MNRTLMRRYYLVNVAKDANVFGILVGTLAVGSLSLSLFTLSVGHV
jgi:diphthamide biosynthesis enzyme Dph1/Dph2-like protein